MKRILIGMICAASLMAGETLTDTTTGLVWQDNSDAKSIRMDAKGAKAYCDALELEGMKGWRLPEVKELQSILDIKRGEPTIKNSFTHVDSIGFYWASTPYAPDDTYGWAVYFYDGKTEKADLKQKGFIRCVRGK